MLDRPFEGKHRLFSPIHVSCARTLCSAHLNQFKIEINLQLLIFCFLCFLIPCWEDSWDTEIGQLKIFTVWLQKRLRYAGLEPVLGHNEKSCIAS